jgi:transcriptional regulator with XRE-family HTH domain
MSPVNVPAIGAYIKEQREQAKISLRQLAQAAGVSNPYLSQIERGLRRPSADILQQIARGLRISAEALYVQAGFLEDRPPGPGVRDAVLADPELTERQKQMLIEVYESFRKETAAALRERAVVVGELAPEDGGSGADEPQAGGPGGGVAQGGPGEGAPQDSGPEIGGPGESEAAGAGPGEAELTEDPSGWFAPDGASREPDSAPDMGRNRVA